MCCCRYGNKRRHELLMGTQLCFACDGGACMSKQRVMVGCIPTQQLKYLIYTACVARFRSQLRLLADHTHGGAAVQGVGRIWPWLVGLYSRISNHHKSGVGQQLSGFTVPETCVLQLNLLLCSCLVHAIQKSIAVAVCG
jgi:hypothetical protein